MRKQQGAETVGRGVGRWYGERAACSAEQWFRGSEGAGKEARERGRRGKEGGAARGGECTEVSCARRREARGGGRRVGKRGAPGHGSQADESELARIILECAFHQSLQFPHLAHPPAAMAPTVDDGGEAADEPPNDAPARTGLDFLRLLHQNPPPVFTAGPSSISGEKLPPTRPPGSPGVEPESALATVSKSEVGESSSAPGKKKRRFAQTHLPFGTPPPKPTPPQAPAKAPPRVSLELTQAEKAEAKFDKALELYISQWLPKFDWLLLDKNDEGLPVLRCSICVEHGKDDAKFGRNGPGGRDMQPGSMRSHELSVKHDEALKKQRTLMAEIEKQRRVDDFANADKEGARLTRLIRAVEFICDNDAPIAMFAKLVGFMAEEGVADIPLKSYGVYISQ
ncbi:unnamed protein product [Closterium sp. Yama58-4]|nr:unnamed protein product [Closterium sp. Yama58-4]